MTGRAITARMGCALATWVDTLAVVLAWAGPSATLALAAALHGLATYLSGWVPESARVAQRSEAKRQLARVMTLCVPVVGPMLAWATRNHHAGSRSHERAQLARFHAQFLEPEEPRPERSPFTGEFERDIEVLTDAESYSAILEFGTPDHKRSALRRLADLGEPQHIRLLRQCLGASDPEIRLFAYGQLEGIEQRLCEVLDAARIDFEENPNDPALRAAYADAHAALASCGALDESMSVWHDAEAERVRSALVDATKAPASGEDGVEGEEAPAALLRTQAEEAFAQRDFDTVRRLAEELIQRGEELPSWLDYVAGDQREGAA